MTGPVAGPPTAPDVELRVEQLAARTGVSVDTVRYYQAKGLLPPPRRVGRVAWYGEHHVERIERVRELQGKGLTLATIVRILDGRLGAADEALLGEVSGGGGPDELLTLDELASRTGVPAPLLVAIEGEGLLVPRRSDGEPRYTAEDVAAAQAALRLLDWGVPLSELLDLAHQHHAAVQATARRAVELFAMHVRGPIRREGTGAEAQVDRLVQAFNDLLPATTTLVAHHFTRTLLQSALDYVDEAGTNPERQAVQAAVGP